MSPNLVMLSDGKKFLWDGQPYDSKEDAARAAQSYQNEDFQIQLVEDDGKFLVYTRRVVKERVAATQ